VVRHPPAEGILNNDSRSEHQVDLGHASGGDRGQHQLYHSRSRYQRLRLRSVHRLPRSHRHRNDGSSVTESDTAGSGHAAVTGLVSEPPTTSQVRPRHFRVPRTTTRSKCSTSTSEAGSGISTSPQRRATERLELLQRSSVSCPVRARHRSLLRTVAATKFSQSDLSISFLLSFGWSIDFGRSATRSEDSTEDRWLSIHTL
jgi:hypothetical protein